MESGFHLRHRHIFLECCHLNQVFIGRQDGFILACSQLAGVCSDTHHDYCWCVTFPPLPTNHSVIDLIRSWKRYRQLRMKNRVPGRHGNSWTEWKEVRRARGFDEQCDDVSSEVKHRSEKVTSLWVYRYWYDFPLFRTLSSVHLLTRRDWEIRLQIGTSEQSSPQWCFSCDVTLFSGFSELGVSGEHRPQSWKLHSNGKGSESFCSESQHFLTQNATYI